MKSSNKNIFITGTDTDAGKTFVTGILCAILKKRGADVCAFKPFQTGCSQESIEHSRSEDLEFIRKFHAGVSVRTEYLLKNPSAPLVAAEAEGIEIDLERVLNTVEYLFAKHEYVLAEGAGGILVPITRSCLTADFIKMLDIPVIIVARPNLGTINHTLLTINEAKARNIEIKSVIISKYPNQTEDLAVKTAPKLIEYYSGIKIGGILPDFGSTFNLDEAVDFAEKNLDLKTIFTLS